jgi:O-antigen/teichoic acid export membrane protein
MNSTRSKLISSSVLLVGAKLLQRSIGLISLLILARLLTPEDFAVVAIVSMVIYLFDVLSSAGSEQYIVHKAELCSGDLNTAWTLDIIIKGALWLILVLSAPFIADYYNNQDLQTILYISSLVLPINALRNPVLHLLRRQLDYSLIFKLSVGQKLFSFTVVMTIVLIEPSYWALIIGDVVAAIVFTLGSYWLHQYRPSLTLEHKGSQWIFSRWMLVKNVVGYARSQIDTFFVSRLFDVNTLGKFYVARDIVMLPGQNIILPAIQPILAAFRHQHNNPQGLAHQLNQTLLVVTSITLPIVVYICQFPQPIIDTLLGEQWTDSYTLMPFLALLILYIPYVLLLEQVLIAKGKIKFACYFDILSLTIIIIGLLNTASGDIELFALYRGLLGIFCTLLLAIVIRIKTPYSIRLMLCWILICTAIAYTAAYIASLAMDISVTLPIVRLLISGISFSAIYIISLWLMILITSPYNQAIDNIRTMLLHNARQFYLKITIKNKGIK